MTGVLKNRRVPPVGAGSEGRVRRTKRRVQIGRFLFFFLHARKVGGNRHHPKQRKPPSVDGLRWKKRWKSEKCVEKSLENKGRSYPLFGIRRGFATPCKDRQGYARCCKFKDLRHFYFSCLPNRACRFHSLQQGIPQGKFFPVQGSQFFPCTRRRIVRNRYCRPKSPSPSLY